MIKSVNPSSFLAVPYLKESLLMQSHEKGIRFSGSKPNVIVGPNGAGKSALLKALALITLSYYTGESALDDHYIYGRDSDSYWSEGRGWPTTFNFLEGLNCKLDLAPAMYYEPGHIPGHEDSIAASMMCGYFDEAKAYGRLVDKKSSGQQSQALLAKMQAVLTGSAEVTPIQYINWRAGKAPRDLSADRFASNYERKAEQLKKQYGGETAGNKPVLLMDEPEQSLDARAEAVLWRQISDADMSKVQVIIASHSVYPLLYPNKFNLIEATPGYAKEVRDLVSA